MSTGWIRVMLIVVVSRSSLHRRAFVRLYVARYERRVEFDDSKYNKRRRACRMNHGNGDYFEPTFSAWTDENGTIFVGQRRLSEYVYPRWVYRNARNSTSNRDSPLGPWNTWMPPFYRRQRYLIFNGPLHVTRRRDLFLAKASRDVDLERISTSAYASDRNREENEALGNERERIEDQRSKIGCRYFTLQLRVARWRLGGKHLTNIADCW